MCLLLAGQGMTSSRRVRTAVSSLMSMASCRMQSHRPPQTSLSVGTTSPVYTRDTLGLEPSPLLSTAIRVKGEAIKPAMLLGNDHFALVPAVGSPPC